VRVLYYTIGVIGSGSIVQGISIANALHRNGVPADYSILNSSPFIYLADRLGIAHYEIPFENEDELSPDTYKDSSLFRMLMDIDPDVLIVDLNWFMLQNFIEDLHCKKIFLCRQLDDTAFTISFPEEPMVFDGTQYNLLIKTEPFESKIRMQEINPIVIRNRDEILSKDAALARLGVQAAGKPVCLYAYNGLPGEYQQKKKMYSYLEDEGYTMLYSTNYEGGLFPAVDYFNAVDLLICGAGYNAFWEAVYFEKEAVFIPFPRHNEDQWKRVDECQDCRFEQNGADQLVEIILGL
jgi:hypothetical protein